MNATGETSSPTSSKTVSSKHLQDLTQRRRQRQSSSKEGISITVTVYKGAPPEVRFHDESRIIPLGRVEHAFNAILRDIGRHNAAVRKRQSAKAKGVGNGSSR